MQDVRSRRVTYKNNTQKLGTKKWGKEDLDIGWRTLKYCISNTRSMGGVDWIHLAQIKDQGPLLVNTFPSFSDD